MTPTMAEAIRDQSSTPTSLPCPRCRDGKETFQYLHESYLFDVDRAREIANDGREPLEIDTESVRESLEGASMDSCHFDHVDPTIPGIIASITYRTEEGEDIQAQLLIDGHHRAGRCLRDDLPYFAYLLDETESDAILIRKQGKKVERETEDELHPVAAKITAEYASKFAASGVLSQRARQVIGGATTHDRRGFGPFGVYVTRAEGAWKWDCSGHKMLDYWMGHGALLMGHGFRPVVEAVKAQMELGTHFGACHELEVRWAELIRDTTPSAERVRFTASGTEATMLALRVARAYTGRQTILKLNGHFHGWHDESMGHWYESYGAGINEQTLDNVETADADEPEELIARIEQGDLAAVIFEPGGGSAGTLPWSAELLKDMRDATTRSGTALIFDEVISAFRCSPGGIQAQTGVIPDLTTLAKIACGGLPGGAVVGKESIMSVFGAGVSRGPRWAQVPHTGTFNANPLTAAAAIAMIENIRDGAAQRTAHEATLRLVAEVNVAAKEEGVDVALYENGTSIFHITIGCAKAGIPAQPSFACLRLYQKRPDLYAMLRRALLLEGIDCHLLHGWVAAVHADPEVLRETGDRFRGAFRSLKALPGFAMP
ncbi:MAG: aminotransferase class III-fold pyridoxal phosphate-dependent enzyme [Gemmataceae bacterium]